MEKRRMWLLAGISFAIAALFLWGTFRFGTAAELFPERGKEPAPAASGFPMEEKTEETAETEEPPVMVYDASAYRRDTPLRDPFRAQVRQKAEPAPGNGSAGKRTETSRPRLCGILISGEDRRAMLELDGLVKTVKEGELAGEWTVMIIEKKQALLSGPAGELTLSL